MTGRPIAPAADPSAVAPRAAADAGGAPTVVADERAPASSVDAPAAPPSPGVPSRMPPWRVRLVYGVLAFIVGGHLVEVVTQREHWPFSPYQMWSIRSTGWEMKDFRVQGVTDEPTPREVPFANNAYLYPLPSRFLTQQLRQGIAEAERGKPARRDAFIRDVLGRYEDRRKAGLHDGPPLRGLRLYAFTWDMNLKADNVDSPTKTLLYETDGARGVKTVDEAKAPKGQEGGDVDPE